MLKIIVNLFKRYDENGFNKNGVHKNGTMYDEKGFNKWGYNKEGYDPYGYDQKGYDKLGYNKKGYDQNGYDTLGYNVDGYNLQGYNKSGFNQFGIHQNGTKYDDKGYNSRGFNKVGIHKNNTRYNDEGYDLTGYNNKGYDIDGNKIKEIEPLYEYYYIEEKHEKVHETNNYQRKVSYYEKTKRWRKGIKKKSELIHGDQPVKVVARIINNKEKDEEFICYFNDATYKFETWNANRHLIDDFIKYIANNHKGVYFKDCKVLWENYKKKTDLTRLGKSMIPYKNQKELIDYYYDHTESICDIKDFNYDEQYLSQNIKKLEKEFLEYNNFKDIIFDYTYKSDSRYGIGLPDFYSYGEFGYYIAGNYRKTEDDLKNMVDRKKIVIIEGKTMYHSIEFHGVYKKIGELPNQYKKIIDDQLELNDYELISVEKYHKVKCHK